MQYRTGTATFTNGSQVVTGTGTSWLSSVSAGNWIVRRGSSSVTYSAYEVGSVDSNTQITLTGSYAGDTATDVEYVIQVDFLANGAPRLNNGDVNPAAIMNRHLGKTINGDLLGSAAYADTGTGGSDVPTNDDLGVTGETVYHSGNVNFDEFLCQANGQSIGVRAYAFDSTRLHIELDRNRYSNDTTVTAVGSATFYNVSGGLNLTSVDLSLVTVLMATPRTMVLQYTTTGLTEGNFYQVRGDAAGDGFIIEGVE